MHASAKNKFERVEIRFYFVRKVLYIRFYSMPFIRTDTNYFTVIENSYDTFNKGQGEFNFILNWCKINHQNNGHSLIAF